MLATNVVKINDQLHGSKTGPLGLPFPPIPYHSDTYRLIYTKAIQLIPPLSRHINQIRALLFSILRLSCFTTDFRVASRNSIGFQYELNMWGRGWVGVSRVCFAAAAIGIWCYAPPTPSKHNNTFTDITYFASRSHCPWMPSFPFPYVVLKHTLNRCYSTFFSSFFNFAPFSISFFLFSLSLSLLGKR